MSSSKRAGAERDAKATGAGRSAADKGDVGRRDPASGPRGTPLETRNDVTLVGRVAAPAEERTLPSGDVLATWRLVVARPVAAQRVREGVRPVTVDTLDCVAWSAGPRRRAAGLVAGDVVQVAGALRRRFWRAGAGAVSRCEVEVASLKRLTRAPATADAPRRRPAEAEGSHEP